MRKTSITGKAMKRYHSYCPAYFPLRFLQILADSFLPYFNLWMSAEIVSALYEGREKRQMVLLVAVTLTGNLLLEAVRAVLYRAAESAQKKLRDNEAAALYRKTLSLDYEKMEDPEIRRMRRMILENSWINGYGTQRLHWNVLELARCAAEFLFSGALAAEMIVLMARATRNGTSVWLFLALAGCVAFMILWQNYSQKEVAKYWDEVGAFMLKENQFARGTRVGGMDCRVYRQQELIDRIEAKMNRDHLKVFARAQKKDLLLRIPYFLLESGSQLCIYLIICLYCILGVFPVGSVIKYVGYLGKITGHANSLFRCLGEMKGNERFLETYLNYFDLKNDLYQGSLAVEKRSDKKFTVSFRDVSFRYSGSDRDALKNISLDLKVGEKLAVVGRNGSGKTTFIKLLCRLYDPTRGEIFMNDFNIRKYDYHQYLALFSVVFQDYQLLALPLGNNVSSAREWDTQKAERLLEETGFGERYREMPKGLETPLYKNFDGDGVNLSGGEAQKVALAKALYRDAPFIILDEPTAALDPVAEAEIYSRFDRIVGDRTAIYISHRLSSCRFCDRIAVFDEGRIVQVGTHEELLSDRGGKYYELWHAQAQYYT
ncbi:MAG: ABC transporter ATP-binding protein/permease [bacterium]|nr:ABC transporter ATP-binding protein/permease [bacterium]